MINCLPLNATYLQGLASSCMSARTFPDTGVPTVGNHRRLWLSIYSEPSLDFRVETAVARHAAISEDIKQLDELSDWIQRKFDEAGKRLAA